MIRQIFRTFITINLGLMWCLAGNSQTSSSLMRIDTTRASVNYWQGWLSNLTDMGVEQKKDSFIVREEVIRMMKDSAYRNSVYPPRYEWPAVIDLINHLELKKAFWHLINLYETDTAHRNLSLGTLVLYDSLIDMDKALLSSYYTYAFTDPEVFRMKNDKPEIYRPDILERKLQTTREIIGYIWAYRKKRSQNQRP